MLTLEQIKIIDGNEYFYFSTDLSNKDKIPATMETLEETEIIQNEITLEDGTKEITETTNTYLHVYQEWNKLEDKNWSSVINSIFNPEK